MGIRDRLGHRDGKLIGVEPPDQSPPTSLPESPTASPEASEENCLGISVHQTPLKAVAENSDYIVVAGAD